MTDYCECAYCSAELEAEDEHGTTAVPTTEEEWLVEAARHADHCEWIRTRAFTRDEQED